MENISIKKVETKREMDDFVKFTNWLYADCPYYVPDLEMDIRIHFMPGRKQDLNSTCVHRFMPNTKDGNPFGGLAGC